ncbi:DNA repair protein RecO [Robiginitalea marina]|uniref:DNA repair protein RecO n=1 Tax=Robiginitalea marina TaxID=2954105 RepID=A0ABT1AWM6_9FLAO|nr:DNA repair protein RecO [Robiginitalea marina]
MPIHSKAIVLNSLKYGDNSLIAKLFTAEAGVQSFMLRGVLQSRRGKLKKAHFQPLTQLEIIATTSPSGRLGYVREAAITYPYISLHSDIRKSAIAMFLSEVLAQSLREEEPNLPLFRYLETALQWLDQHGQVANFHLAFLIGLSRYLGFYPAQDDPEAGFFDLAEGAFCREPTLNPCMAGEEVAHFKAFLGTGFEAIHQVGMTQKQRRALLGHLVQYYEVHLNGFRKPKSLAVLDEVFS